VAMLWLSIKRNGYAMCCSTTSAATGEQIFAWYGDTEIHGEAIVLNLEDSMKLRLPRESRLPPELWLDVSGNALRVAVSTIICCKIFLEF
jgi:hypothetical protein